MYKRNYKRYCKIKINFAKPIFTCDYLCTDAGANVSLPLKCRLLVRSSGGEGVMVYTASMYLRPGTVTGCVDYVQFGQDDLIPFITLRKSEKEPILIDL